MHAVYVYYVVCLLTIHYSSDVAKVLVVTAGIGLVLYYMFRPGKGGGTKRFEVCMCMCIV